MLISNHKNIDSFCYAFAMLIPAVGFFSPFLGLVCGILFLIFSSGFLKREVRYSSSLCIVILMAAMFASRSYNVTTSDDFYHYYNSYLEYAGDWGQIFEFGGGFEIGLGFILYVAYNLFPAFSPSGLMFFVIFIELMIYVVVLEVFVLGHINSRIRSISLSIFLVMSLGILAGQLSRQYGAIPMLIAAVFAVSKRDKLIFFLLALVFHISSIFIYPLVCLFVWGAKSWKRFICAAALVFLFFYLFEYVGNLWVGFDYLNQKQGYFELESQSSDMLRNYIVLMMISLFLMLFASIIQGGVRKSPVLYQAFLFNLIILLFMVIYSDYGTFAYRSLLPVVVFFIWYYLVKIISDKMVWIGTLISLALLMFVVRSWLPSGSDTAMGLWRQYPIISVNPGYYIYNFFM